MCSHYTFLAPCNLWGRLVARSLCRDATGVDRAVVHQRVAAEALAFFDRTLGRP